MTSSNQHRIIRGRQSALSQTPADFYRAWVTNETFTVNDTFEQSETLTGDRLIAALLNTASGVTGQVPAEWGWGQNDWMFEMGFLNPFAKTPEADGANIVSFDNTTDVIETDNDITFVEGDLVRVTDPDNAGNTGLFKAISGSGLNTLKIGSGGTLTDNVAVDAAARVKIVGIEGASGDITATAGGIGSTALSWAARSWIVPGMACKIGGGAAGGAAYRFAVAGLNRFATVKAGKSATALPLADKGGSWATNDGSGKTVRIWFGDFLDHGNVALAPLETHEAVYLGQATPVHINFKDLIGNELVFDLQRRSRIQSTLSMLGLSDGYSTAAALDASPGTPTFYQPMLTGDNIGEIDINEVARASHSVVKALNFSLNNNVQSDGPLNSKYDTSYDAGDAILRCGVTAKFGSDIDWAAFRSGAKMSVLCPFYDGANHGYALKVWAGKYVDGDRAPGGRNQPVDFTGTIQGYKDPDTGKMLTMTRFEYLEV